MDLLTLPGERLGIWSYPAGVLDHFHVLRAKLVGVELEQALRDLRQGGELGLLIDILLPIFIFEETLNITHWPGFVRSLCSGTGAVTHQANRCWWEKDHGDELVPTVWDRPEGLNGSRVSMVSAFTLSIILLTWCVRALTHQKSKQMETHTNIHTHTTMLKSTHFNIKTTLVLCYSTLFFWYSGTLVVWYTSILVFLYSGILVLWYTGTLAVWYSYTLALWYSGTLVTWYSSISIFW